MLIQLPEFCLVALVGASGSGKSHFAASHFDAFETLSSDFFRGLVSGDPMNQAASGDAFACLYEVAAKRLARRKLTVIDATHLDELSRKNMLALAREHHCRAIAIALDVPEEICQKRNRKRPGRKIPAAVVERQCRELPGVLKKLKDEGFYRVYVLEDDERAELERVPLSCNWPGQHGPFDIIGDVHGCFDELCQLLGKLGWKVDRKSFQAWAPQGRKAIFVGDLGDRGPASLDCFRLAMNMCRQKDAFWVLGNHDEKLARKLAGHKVSMTQGIETTLAECEKGSPAFLRNLQAFLERLPHHLVLDGGRLVVAHAGIKEELQGRDTGTVRAFCLYGDVDGTKDELGLPVRKDWAALYSGKGFVVYGHTPMAKARFLNNTACIDTGCVFGGALSALRYPEMEIVQVAAKREYCAPPRPLA